MPHFFLKKSRFYHKHEFLLEKYILWILDKELPIFNGLNMSDVPKKYSNKPQSRINDTYAQKLYYVHTRLSR